MNCSRPRTVASRSPLPLTRHGSWIMSRPQTSFTSRGKRARPSIPNLPTRKRSRLTRTGFPRARSTLRRVEWHSRAKQSCSSRARSRPVPGFPSPLRTIWQRHLVSSLRLIDIHHVVGISKKNLVAMDKSMANKMSGAGVVPLDLMMARELKKEDFGVAVVAWDLQPPWAPDATCRWEEVRSLYRGLSRAEALPENPWRRWARNRFRELSGRKKGQAMPDPPVLEVGAVLAVCMEPTFESLLIVCEQTIRRTLGVKDRRRVKWPNWDKHRQRPEDLLQLRSKPRRTSTRKRGRSNSFGAI